MKKNISEAEALIKKQHNLKAKTEALLAKARQDGATIRNLAGAKAEEYLQSQIKAFDKELLRRVAKEEERLSRLKHQLGKDIAASSEMLTKEILRVILPAAALPTSRVITKN